MSLANVFTKPKQMWIFHQVIRPFLCEITRELPWPPESGFSCGLDPQLMDQSSGEAREPQNESDMSSESGDTYWFMFQGASSWGLLLPVMCRCNFILGYGTFFNHE